MIGGNTVAAMQSGTFYGFISLLEGMVGRFKAEIAEIAPRGERRMSANPHANGGLLLRDLCMPDFRDYAVAVPKPGAVTNEATRVLGGFLRDVTKLNRE